MPSSLTALFETWTGESPASVFPPGRDTPLGYRYSAVPLDNVTFFRCHRLRPDGRFRIFCSHRLSVTSEIDCSCLLEKITIRVLSGWRSRDLFVRGFVATNYAMNSSTVVQMQLKANSIFGDLDVFQSNGPSFKRRLEEWSFLWMLSAVCLYDDYRNSRLEVEVAPLKGHIPLMVVAKSAKYLQY